MIFTPKSGSRPNITSERLLFWNKSVGMASFFINPINFINLINPVSKLSAYPSTQSPKPPPKPLDHPVPAR